MAFATETFGNLNSRSGPASRRKKTSGISPGTVVTGVSVVVFAWVAATLITTQSMVLSLPGADMSAANPAQSFALVRGTSFASPIVAGLLAEAVHEPDADAARRAVADLAGRAIDLGAPGLDPVYGYGLVGEDLRPEISLARGSGGADGSGSASGGTGAGGVSGHGGGGGGLSAGGQD